MHRLSEKLEHVFFPELAAVLMGIISVALGGTIVLMPGRYAEIESFRQAFAIVPAQVWGLAMVCLGLAMTLLLIPSRVYAAVPTFLLGLVWLAWAIPIVATPNFAPSAPIVYGGLCAFTGLIGLACLVERKRR